MLNKILMLLILLMVSCTMHRIKGPNYNQGRTHNADQANRIRIVNAEDRRMKKTIQKSRDKAARYKETKRKKDKKQYKYI